MTSQTPIIADGLYHLYPEGSAWIAARFRGGRCVAQTEQANHGSHVAAGDDWSDGAPDAATESDVARDVAAQIVRRVMGDDTYPEYVVVVRAGG